MNATIEIPERLSRRPMDSARGVPIPYVTATNPDGTHNFRAIDERRTLEAISNHLCGLCGEPLAFYMAFIGGPLAVANRSYSDPAMHLDCAEYARLVCPFLVHSRGHHAKPVEGTFEPPGFVAGKPEKVVVYVTRGYKLQPVAGGGWIIRPDKAIRIEEHDYAT